jgi:serine/threonine protein kinase
VCRAYDNRFRFTLRDPVVYFDRDIVQGTDMVVVLGDEDHLKLQHVKVREQVRERDWLWNKGGLTIISTPFLEGRHWAESPAEFVPVVKFLELMHSKGYVHVDIRAFNMLICKDSKSRLIDFDMSRKIDTGPKYPANYQDLLADGKRMGQSGKLVTKWDDWAALLNVIFEVHKPEPTTTPDFEIFRVWRELVNFPLSDPETANLEGLAVDLIKFLNDIEGKWTLQCDSKFERLLDDYGFKTTPKKIRVTSDPDSGSPPKRKLTTMF